MPKVSTLPPPLLSTEPGTWAHDTMSRRINDEILQRTYEENISFFESNPTTILDNFNALRTELQSSSKLLPLHDLTSEELNDPERVLEWNQWMTILQPHLQSGNTWLSTPWMIAEFYVYRRLMQAIGYYNKSNSQTYLYDPFAKAKRAGLVSSVGSAEPLMGRISNLPHTKDGAALAAAFALWGNKMDLSLWPANNVDDGAPVDVFTSILETASDNLLHDDTNQLTSKCEELRMNGGGNVDIIVDNAGFELVTDLALADHYVASGIASTITFQLKAHPTFVSDALTKDLMETVEYYMNLDKNVYPNANAAGHRWKLYLEKKQWICHEDNFWVQPPPMWDMYQPLYEDMKSRCDLAFVKGDANYRRLLGDLFWDYSIPFEDVVGSYFPCPVCALRTLKAEVGCGMDSTLIERAKEMDEKWMVNGRFGVVQYGSGVGKK